MPNTVGADGPDTPDKFHGRAAPANTWGELHAWFRWKDEANPFVHCAVKARLIHPGLAEMDPPRRFVESIAEGSERKPDTLLDPRGVRRVLHPLAIYEAEPVRVRSKAVAVLPRRGDLILEFN